MKRLVVITGFGNSQRCANNLGEALANHLGYDDYTAYALGFALKEPTQFATAVEDADVYTHSAGILALQDTRPKSIHAFNPPLPSTRLVLAARAALRVWKERETNVVHRTIRPQASGGLVREILSDPQLHLSPFIDGRIAQLDSIQLAIDASRAGTDVGLAYTDQDSYFIPSEQQILAGRENGVIVAQIPGVHNELILRPAQTVDNYFSTRF